jgi:hypothetical protein
MGSLLWKSGIIAHSSEKWNVRLAEILSRDRHRTSRHSRELLALPFAPMAIDAIENVIAAIA